jgi:hypothetical protein
MIEGLRETLSLGLVFAVSLVTGALAAGMLTRATRGWRAWVLAGVVAGWCALWLAHVYILIGIFSQRL